MTALNIGIVAHVDAGKTSLTERILFETHIIDEVGRVDKGTTQTDSLELERRRGITIKASVVSFVVNAQKINLIDTPGHADFLAEVERSVSVLDGAILVISAVEGIQPQTTVLFAALKKLRIPTIIFINKIDRTGAQSDALIAHIRQKLTDTVIPLTTPHNIGTKNAEVVPNDWHDSSFLNACIEGLALNDEGLLAAYVEGESISPERLQVALRQQVADATLCPVFFGSAIMGVGVAELLAELPNVLPTTPPTDDAELSGVVFKLTKEATGEKVAFVRVYAGCLKVRTSVGLQRWTRDGTETYASKVQKLHEFWEGSTRQVQEVGAGEFCKVWGLRDAKIGDVVGQQSNLIKTLRFATPHMETRIAAADHTNDHALYQALLELAEEDPLISVLKDDLHHTIYLHIFGEVQKEVIESILKESYGLDVVFSETGIVCIEKPRGRGEAAEGDGLFKAGVGLRVDPGIAGSGLTYHSTPGALPLTFHRTIEEAVRTTLMQGLYGWNVTDIVVTVTNTVYNSHHDDGTHGSDFRDLVPLVLMAALFAAGTDVYEPINGFELSIPDHALNTTLFKLSALGAIYEGTALHGDTFHVTGTLPVATTDVFRRDVPTFTGGEGVLVTHEAGYRKIEGDPPTRKRMDYNPLNRKEYLLHVQNVMRIG